MDEKKKTETAAEAQSDGVLKLRVPIDIDGDKVTQVTYDFNELTGKDMNAIDRHVSQIMSGSVSLDIAGFNSAKNRYTFMQAVLIKNKSYDVKDLERMKLRDLSAGERLARDFLLRSEDGTE